MTAEPLRIAIQNTVTKPRNHAPLIYQAIQNDEGRAVTSSIGLLVSNYEVTDDGQKEF
jgi:hypothetical protein